MRKFCSTNRFSLPQGGATSGYHVVRSLSPQLVREPWILAPPEIVEGSPIVEAFRAMGLPTPQATVLGLSLPLRHGLLATGRFLTIVPGSLMRFGVERAILKGAAHSAAGLAVTCCDNHSKKLER